MNPRPPDFAELLRDSGFRDPAAAAKRLQELSGDTGEMLALARAAGLLRDLLRESADPDAALLHLARFVEVRGGRHSLYRSFLDHPALLDRFVQVTAASRYLADILVRAPDSLALFSDARLLAPRDPRAVVAEFASVCSLYPTEDAQLDAARRLHRREVLRIGAADLLGLIDLETAARQVSDLADAFAGQCLRILGGGRLIVVALGKWGGRELNYSSDIDLLFLAPRASDLPAATALARRLIRALGAPTFEGVVYRVDLRLRPYGSEGELVCTPAMLEDYLRNKAKPAERQMMLKARAAAGLVAAGGRFLRGLAPAILQDASSARSQVRRLKSRIEALLHERDQADGHVKLAPGGIRDIEFLAQALQLEAGRARPEVLDGHTLGALGRLEKAGILASHDARGLREAYVFLRAVEHRIQLMENQQVYRLPRRREDLERLARTMGFHEADRLLDAYDARTRKVRAVFDRLLSGGRPTAGPDAESLLRGTRKVGLQAVRDDARRWTVSIAAPDRRGLLSLMTGLLAAHRADIRSGDFRKAPRGRALATFEVVLPSAGKPAFWASFRRELADLLEDPAAQDRIVDRLAAALDSPSGPLLPMQIEVRNERDAAETELHLLSADAPGFLFEFAAALATLGVEIQGAVIRTLDDGVYDTFRVTDLQGRRITGGRAVEELRAAAALVRQFMHLLPRAPDPTQALRQFSAFLRETLARPDWVRKLRSLESESVLSALSDLMGVSRFLWEDFLLLQHENLFPVVSDTPALDRRKTRERAGRELARKLAGAADAEEALARLNEFKDREMFRIDLRHITRRSGFPEFMETLSDLAELVVARAAELGAPGPTPWCVAGLGKFGGRELGIGSDLDLMVAYGDAPGADPHAFAEFAKGLGRALRARREGSFSIDLRLRPHGDSGAMATSLEGFLQYYADGGAAQPFERLALVKFRPVAGSAALGARLCEARDAFVYSARPLDLGNLLHLRKRQAAELVPAGELNAKVSPGGLVDVEYFVQARQIAAGAADRSVRVTNTLEAIERLVHGGHVRRDLGVGLTAATVFLRRLVDALRVVRGSAKDALLPPAGSREFDYLVRRLGYATAAHLGAEIRQRMSFARNLWIAGA